VITPIRVADQGPGPERCYAALFLSDPEQGMAPPTELLHQLYGLTPAEAALACELASGRSLEETAEDLGVTRGTARQRLGHVFLKTATSRQAALVRLLLTGPAQLRVEEPGAPSTARGDESANRRGRSS
jgi:DNA-binding CsgD family transcriptional regulator